MFIDIHAHAYLFPSPPQDGHTQFCTPEELLEYYDQVGIERGILLPLIGPEVYLPQSNQEILEICRRYPQRFSPFCNIDPRGIANSVWTDFSVWLDWYQEHGVLGVGEFMPNMAFQDPRVLNFFRQVAQRHWPLTFDVTTQIGASYGLVDDPGLPQLEFCLRNFPDLIILGHGPAFWSEMGQLETIGDRGGYPKYPIRAEGAVPKLFRRYQNLWGDLSAGSGYNALARDVDHAILFLNEFQDRLCYGTDYCSVGGELPLAEFLLDLRKSGHLSADVFEKIARGNAIRLLHLPEK
ncbi:MAG: amidohydrolase family protein [Lentisphaerae bacterium]|jgi:predicted TIM-barrel fold metal-dependent hydrolase|nr:amidohydrolase family protein [Lentisphaerota bacterium]